MSDYFVVCHTDDCGGEGYWSSVLADRATDPPSYCPVCGEPTDEVQEADLNIEVLG